MIAICDVSKNFGGRSVLKNVSLSLESRQTHVILGSSGCGKSTLLRLIMGLIRPDDGTIKVDGVLQNSKTQKELAKKVGYVIQEVGLFPHLTAHQNVLLPMRIANVSLEESLSRLYELCQWVGLNEALLAKYPQQLSGGQRQRVGLMRALMLNPKILLLDEPLGALDPLIRSELQDELKNIFNRLQKTVVIVTHDIAEAAFFGHTVTLLHEGEVIQHGTFQELLNTPATPFVSKFIKAQRYYIENGEV